MSHEVAFGKPDSGIEQVSCRASSSSIFSPPDRGWQPVRLPELATNGLPFSPTFILPKSGSSVGVTVPTAGNALPFGFHYWQRHAISNRPVIDLTKGYYDPHTQTYTIPLQAGGDTDGGVIPTGYWTEKCGGDGEKPSKEWDTNDDKVTD